MRIVFWLVGLFAVAAALALLMGQVHGALRERYQLFLLRKAWVYPFCTTSPG